MHIHVLDDEDPILSLATVLAFGSVSMLLYCLCSFGVI